jgi:two-component system response regulator GlrR
MHALLIEDDAVNTMLVTRRLEVAGITYACAEEGGAGISLAREGAFDVVLLDLRLPDMDGFEVLAALRAVRPGLPVVIMTAHGSPEVAARAAADGAVSCLIKPVSRKAMIAAMEAAVLASPPEAR